MTREAAQIAYKAGQDAYAAFESTGQSGDWNTAVQHINDALRHFQKAAELYPEDAAVERAATHNFIGSIFGAVGRTEQAIEHYQLAIRGAEAAKDPYLTGQYRTNAALTLWDASELAAALAYARAAMTSFGAAESAPDLVLTGHLAATLAAQTGDTDLALAQAKATRKLADDIGMHERLQAIDQLIGELEG